MFYTIFCVRRRFSFLCAYLVLFIWHELPLALHKCPLINPRDILVVIVLLSSFYRRKWNFRINLLRITDRIWCAKDANLGCSFIELLATTLYCLKIDNYLKIFSLIYILVSWSFPFSWYFEQKLCQRLIKPKFFIDTLPILVTSTSLGEYEAIFFSFIIYQSLTAMLYKMCWKNKNICIVLCALISINCLH